MRSFQENAFLEQQDVYSQSSSTEVCDRRLSRAARTLLHKHVRRLVVDLDIDIGIDRDYYYSEDSVWTLLEHWLQDATSAECPLFRDVGRHDEEHSVAVKAPDNLKGAYPTYVLQQRRQASPKRPQHWFQCGYCGKTFATRYYLDVHLQHHHNNHNHHHHHHHHHEHDNARTIPTAAVDPSLVCPAQEWCRVVGGLANCHEQALKDEPYYDRGSSGWGADGKSIQHKWTKLAHSVPCDLETIRADCRTVLLDSCRVSDASLVLLCDMLSCPRHHFWQTPSLVVPDHWHEMWLQESHHHGSGVVGGILLCLGLCAYVYAMTTTLTTNRRSSKKQLPRNISNRSPFSNRSSFSKDGKAD
jgi:hypothetical protein